MNFLDIKEARKFIERTIAHYHAAPGWFTDWLDDLYIRLSESWATIQLDELATLASLMDDDGYMPEPYAVNRVYHFFDRVGRDTSGILGY